MLREDPEKYKFELKLCIIHEGKVYVRDYFEVKMLYLHALDVRGYVLH